MIEAKFDSCLAKQQRVRDLFSACTSPELIYEKIIEIGRALSPYPQDLKTPERLVKGCQSEMYIDASLSQGKIFFRCYSEALISAGLAALLIAVYSEEPPAAILACPPLFLKDLGIQSSLSPGRANGLSSLFLRMKQEALRFVVAD